MTRILVPGLLVLAVVSLAGIGLAQTPDAPAQLKGVKVTELPQSLTVSVETSGPLRYQATLLDSPTRIVIDMNGTYAVPRARWSSTPEPIREIRGSQWKPGTARLVVELTRQVRYRLEEGVTGLTLALEPAREGRSEGPKARALEATTDGPKSNVPAPSPPKARPPKPDLATREAPRPDTPKPDGAVAGADAQTAPVKNAPTLAAAPMPVPEAAAFPLQVAQTAPRGGAPAAAAPARQPQPQGPSNGAKLITLDFKDADVINVLRLLGAEGGRNIVVGDDVKGKVSVSLHGVTWDQSLDTILEARALQKVEKDGVIRIVSREQLTKEREAQAKSEEAKVKAEIDVRTKLAEAQLKEQQVQQRKLVAEAVAAEAQARGPLKEEILRLSYADPGEIANTLQGVLGLGQQLIEPCIKVTESERETKVEFRTGGGVTSGPIAEPPFSQLFGPPRPPEPERAPPAPPEVVFRGLTIRAHCTTNSLFLRLYTTDLDRVKKLIRESLDIPLPQVKIEARMEILDRTALEAIGIQWGGAGAGNAGKTTLLGQGFQPNFRPPGTGTSNVSPPNSNLDLTGLLPVTPGTGLPLGGNLVNLPIAALPAAAGVVPTAGLAFGIVGTNFNINLALEALATLGKTRTLARPEIVTVENHTATMSLGEEIPYATVSSAGTQIQFKEALLKLEVIPMVILEKVDGQERRKIKMFVVVENNSRGDVVNLGASGTPPAINKRRARTQVLINEGERLVIGGVTTGQTENTTRKVPVFGDIPVVGWLFKQKETFEQGRELVVFLTPSVLKASLAAPAPTK